MPWVAILGADGAGKSSVIDVVVDRLATHGVEVDYHHWCPKLRDTGEESVVNIDPHGQKPRNAIVSNIKLFYLLIIWRYSFLRKIKKVRKAGSLVLFDRYYQDILADPRRYRFSGSILLTKLIFWLMPKPDKVFLLNASPDVLLSRKREVEPNVLKGIVSRYRIIIESNPRGVLIDASQPIAKVAEDVLGELSIILGEDV
jgi:thymidylate kinase